MRLIHAQVQPEMALCAARMAATSQEPGKQGVGAIQLTVLAGFRGTVHAPISYLRLFPTRTTAWVLAVCRSACCRHLSIVDCTSTHQSQGLRSQVPAPEVIRSSTRMRSRSWRACMARLPLSNQVQRRPLALLKHMIACKRCFAPLCCHNDKSVGALGVARDIRCLPASLLPLEH